MYMISVRGSLMSGRDLLESTNHVYDLSEGLSHEWRGFARVN